MTNIDQPTRTSFQRQVYSIAQAAEYLGCSTRMIQKLIKKNEIRIFHVGRLVKITRIELEAFIEANVVQ